MVMHSPTDASQWSDQDGDGYGDNPNGNAPDSFPNDSTQWSDQDGDGYGDNPTGNNGDASQPTVPNGLTKMEMVMETIRLETIQTHSSDGTQWYDADGDGYGDNQNGNNADRFTSEPTHSGSPTKTAMVAVTIQQKQSDLCLNTIFRGKPLIQTDVRSNRKTTIWTEYQTTDACPMTPAGETVDSTGCSGSQEDADNDGVMGACFNICSLTLSRCSSRCFSMFRNERHRRRWY